MQFALILYKRQPLLNKMKFKILLFLFTTLAFSQQPQQASYWYFGANAGVKFDTTGSVTALTDGQLNTLEGCASISDTNGDLLFYTDGVKIWNKNHTVMPNGSGLMGNVSTSQSAIIVPKPGSNNLYYVFTLDYEVHPNGFRYSIVDINLNGGLGDVTSSKNILIYTPSDEKLTATKHSNGTDYWIVTHGWNNNTFYSYQLTAAGLSATPVTSNAGVVVTGNTDVVFGCMKISPDGSKLAVARVTPCSEVMDFDTSTGIVSNSQIIYTGLSGYGIEFSPNSRVLYFTVAGVAPYQIYQYDLTNPNVASTSVTVYNSGVAGTCALQLGPNNKIYIAEAGRSYLGSIDSPDVIGMGCNIQVNSVDLLGKKCNMGLPAFVPSFFNTTSITATDGCVGDNIQFNLISNQVTGSVSWDFGDGNSSYDLNPSHQYTTAGNYTIQFNATTSSGGSVIRTKNITIYPQPNLLTTIVNLKQCDDDNDGFSAFNLNQAISSLVVNTTGLTITFHETLAEAQSGNNPITNTTAYNNQLVSNDTIYIRVINTNGCFKTAQLNLIVSTTSIPTTFQLSYSECDNTASGSNTDGISTFDFSNATAQVQALFPAGQLLNITFYKNSNDALAEINPITNTANYSNIGYPNTENIYVRVESQVNNECLGLGHHITLNVEPIPIVQPQTIRHCDDDHDGIYNFDTTNLQTNLLNGITNVTITYFDQSGNPVTMSNPFTSTSQTINVKVKNNFGKQCEFTTTIQFIVDELPQFFSIPPTLTTACDDEAIPTLQDGYFPFNTANFEATILGSQTGMIVKYYDANNNSLPSPLPNPFLSNTQNIYVEVVNPNNLNCKAYGVINFIVNPVPNINLTGSELICSNNPSFVKTLDAGIINPNNTNSYIFTWYWNNITIPSANQQTLTVNSEGTYSVNVKNSAGCSRTRTINVNASNSATLENILVNDLSENNEIQIIVSGLGDYLYSINNIDFQSSNIFSPILPGDYTIYVKDAKGCGTITQNVSVLSIPLFFTPNNDGNNDYWNIKGTTYNFNSNSTVQVLDRYGKLMKQFSASSIGWDGKYLGQLMPSDDYWYIAQLTDGRTIKGHFTLKR